VFLTAFYMFRAYFLAFWGEWRGGAHGTAIDLHATDATFAGADPHGLHDVSGPQAAVAAIATGGPDAGAHDSGHGTHGMPHESPPVMTIPLILLAIPTIFAGFWALLGPLSFASFIEGQPVPFEMNVPLAIVSLGLALLGILLAYLTYGIRKVPAVSIRGLYDLLYHRYWLDEIYQQTLDVVIHGAAIAVAEFDRWVIDGLVNGVGSFVVLLGSGVRRLESGRVQGYAMMVFGGLLVILIFTTVLPLFGITTR